MDFGVADEEWEAAVAAPSAAAVIQKDDKFKPPRYRLIDGVRRCCVSEYE